MASDRQDRGFNHQFGGMSELIALADMIDAARYRWLRNKARKLQGDNVPYVACRNDADGLIHGEQLDMVIDAHIGNELAP